MGGRLEIREVTKTFPGTRGKAPLVLDELDIVVESGTSLVILGPSGTGKTTLLRIIAGLETADAGTVALAGRTLSDPHPLVLPEHRGIGMVFQALELWPQMTAAEHLAFGLPGRPRGHRALHDPRVEALAFEVGLTAEHLSRRPDTLSGGERQRVAIARTLAPDPDVVLYDEPLANLDPDRRASLRALVRRLGEERGTTVVYVTHDADEALAIGDEIAVLSHGAVHERQTPEALYAAPRTLAGARALGPVTVRAARVAATQALTTLGDADLVDPKHAHRAAAKGPVVALWRPEQIHPTDAAGAPVGQVSTCRPAGCQYVFTAAFEDGEVVGTSPTRLTLGDTVGLRTTGPVAVVRAPAAPKETAA